jgi:hypothetical protein
MSNAREFAKIAKGAVGLTSNTDVANHEFLKWNGTEWVNETKSQAKVDAGSESQLAAIALG